MLLRLAPRKSCGSIIHWCALPLLLGLILSGISIYWSSPIFQHATDPTTGNFDDAADIGIWLCAHVPWMHNYGSPPDWVYNHFSLGQACSRRLFGCIGSVPTSSWPMVW